MNQSQFGGERINILIVDDNPDNLRLLSDILTNKGYQIRRVISGKMALQAVKKHKFDLILLDINMPDINGYEVCHKLKSDPETIMIPVIFISALNESIDKVKAFEVGGIDYISKPFQFEEVIIRVENQVKILDLQQELIQFSMTLEQQIKDKNERINSINKDLKKYKQELLHKSLKDSVTNLDNKSFFMGKLRQMVERTKIQADSSFTILAFDCYCPQFFTRVFALKVEDAIACEIAKILTNSISLSNSTFTSKTIARLRDWEFATIVDNLQDTNVATKIAQGIQEKLNFSFEFQGEKLEIKTAYGIVSFPETIDTAESLLQNARTIARQARNKNYSHLRI